MKVAFNLLVFDCDICEVEYLSKVAFDLTCQSKNYLTINLNATTVFDLSTPVFDLSTSRRSNATFSNSTLHSTRIFLPNHITFLRVAFDFLAILIYVLKTCRIVASSMWNLTLSLGFHIELAGIRRVCKTLLKVECDTQKCRWVRHL